MMAYFLTKILTAQHLSFSTALNITSVCVTLLPLKSALAPYSAHTETQQETVTESDT